MRSLVRDLRICCDHIRDHRQRQLTAEARILDAERRGGTVSPDDLLAVSEATSAVAILTQAARNMAGQAVDIERAGRSYPDLFAQLSAFDQRWAHHVREACALGFPITPAFEAYRVELQATARGVPLTVVAALFVTLSATLHQFPVAVHAHAEAQTARHTGGSRRRDHLALVHSA